MACAFMQILEPLTCLQTTLGCHQCPRQFMRHVTEILARLARRAIIIVIGGSCQAASLDDPSHVLAEPIRASLRLFGVPLVPSDQAGLYYFQALLDIGETPRV